MGYAESKPTKFRGSSVPPSPATKAITLRRRRAKQKSALILHETFIPCCGSSPLTAPLVLQSARAIILCSLSVRVKQNRVDDADHWAASKDVGYPRASLAPRRAAC